MPVRRIIEGPEGRVAVKRLSITALVVVGIDPGKHGGIAQLVDRRNGSPVACKAWPMPDTATGVIQVMREACGRLPGQFGVLPVELHVFIEKVGGWIRGADEGAESGGAANGSAMFVFGKSAGWAEMAAVAVSSLPPREVQSAAWIESSRVEPRRREKEGRKTVKLETKSKWKGRVRDAAAERFTSPGLKVTLATADALFIAWHGMLVASGQVEPPKTKPPKTKPRRKPGKK